MRFICAGAVLMLGMAGLSNGDDVTGGVSCSGGTSIYGLNSGSCVGAGTSASFSGTVTSSESTLSGSAYSAAVTDGGVTNSSFGAGLNAVFTTVGSGASGFLILSGGISGSGDRPWDGDWFAVLQVAGQSLFCQPGGFTPDCNDYANTGSFSITLPFTLGSSFTVIEAVDGEDSGGLTYQGSSVTISLNYQVEDANGNPVQVSLAPEPSSSFLVFVGVVAMATRRAMRRQFKN